MKKIYAILFIVLVLCNIQCTKESEISRPNIILINVDDMGWKDVGFMGSNYYETPNIDYLSSLGMVFTNGYASASNCAPSRACLMTGQWTPRHGIYTVGSSKRGKSEDRKLIPTKNTTKLSKAFQVLPKVLHQNGYVTCHSGKWHISKHPLEYGFDLNIGGGGNGLPRSYYPPYKNVKLKGGKDQYLTDLIMEKTVKFIDTVAIPFFLNYAPYAVHTPIMPVKRLLGKYEKKPASEGQGNAGYATMIENLDRNIGLLINKLKERNLFNNTLIVFTGDNGGLYGITKQNPLRAGKGSYYEGGIREPFFFVLKDKIKPNTKSNVPITNLDIFPTILNYAKVDDATLFLDGNNITTILQEETKYFERPLFWNFPIYLQAYNVTDNENRDSLFRTRPGSIVRKGDWKLHYYFEDNDIELYNLSEDIGENNNLVDINPEKKEELFKILKKWWKDTNAPIPKSKNLEYINKI